MIFSICLIMPEMMYMKWGSEFSEIASFTRPPVVYCSSSRNLYDHRHTHGAELCFLCGDQTRELFFNITVRLLVPSRNARLSRTVHSIFNAFTKRNSESAS